jgi:hypothetical protein
MTDNAAPPVEVAPPPIDGVEPATEDVWPPEDTFVPPAAFTACITNVMVGIVSSLGGQKTKDGHEIPMSFFSHQTSMRNSKCEWNPPDWTIYASETFPGVIKGVYFDKATLKLIAELGGNAGDSYIVWRAMAHPETRHFWTLRQAYIVPTSKKLEEPTGTRPCVVCKNPAVAACPACATVLFCSRSCIDISRQCHFYHSREDCQSVMFKFLDDHAIAARDMLVQRMKQIDEIVDAREAREQKEAEQKKKLEADAAAQKEARQKLIADEAEAFRQTDEGQQAMREAALLLAVSQESE